MATVFPDDEPAGWKSSQKLSYKRVSYALDQLTRLAVPEHLKQLEATLSVLSEEQNASQENISTPVYATRIPGGAEHLDSNSQVQKSLALLAQDLRTLEDMKMQMQESDVEKFVSIVEPTCRQLHQAIRDAKKVVLTCRTKRRLSSTRDAEMASGENNPDSENCSHETTQDTASTQYQWSLEEEDLQAKLLKAEKLESIANDMADLREVMALLNQNISECAPAVDGVETYVGDTVVRLTLSEKLLAQARQLKPAAFPAALGATVGLAAGGPIGAVAGARVGLTASLIAGALGYVGGTVFDLNSRLFGVLRRPLSL